MTVLLLPETTGDKLVHDATARAVSAAASLGDVDVLCAGASMAEAAGEAAKIAGVSRVLVAEDEVLDHHLAEPMAALIAGIAAIGICLRSILALDGDQSPRATLRARSAWILALVALSG